MERSFIRMQMLAKLEEFCFYTDKYIQEINKERKLLVSEFTETELEEFDDLSQLYVFKPIWTFLVKKLKTLSVIKLVNFSDFNSQS